MSNLPKAYNPQTGQTYQLDPEAGAWVPVGADPAQEVPGFLSGPAMGQGAIDMLQRMGSRLGLVEPPDPQAMAKRRELFPKASMIGEALPTMAGGPAKALPQIAFSAGMGALSADDPRTGALYGAGGAFAGQQLGSMAGRMRRASSQAIRRLGANDELPSGIRRTTGQTVGSESLQQAESSMARNPITSRPFTQIAQYNRRVLEAKAIAALGVSADSLQEAMGKARKISVRRMERAVPAGARIEIPEDVLSRFKRLNRLTDELFDFPESNVISGAEFRSVRSDVGDLLTSSKSGVRKQGRAILEALDDAAMQNEAVIPELYAKGRAQYRVVKALERGQAIGKDGINAPTLRNNLRKSYGQGTDVRLGNQSTGIPEIDDLQNTLEDYIQAGIVGADSGTPTGLSIPLLAGDFATTGGVGTLSMFGASQLSQTGAGRGFAQGLMQAAPEAGRAGAAVGRGLGVAADDDDDE